MLPFYPFLYMAFIYNAIIIRKYLKHMVFERIDIKLFYRFYFLYCHFKIKHFWGCVIKCIISKSVITKARERFFTSRWNNVHFFSKSKTVYKEKKQACLWSLTAYIYHNILVTVSGIEISLNSLLQHCK